MTLTGCRDTPNQLIHVGRPIEFDGEKLRERLEELYETANRDENGRIREMVKELVPTYRPQG